MRSYILASILLLVGCCTSSYSAEPSGDGYQLPQCEVIPLPANRLSFRLAGKERAGWHFAQDAPRPFFYPLTGPAGTSLTRMGHPGAPNHDHHRSVWFAHQNVNGVDFWSDNTDARIRQKRWLAYADGQEEAMMATLLGWYGPDGQELMEQELVTAFMPLEAQEIAMELQITLRPPPQVATVKLGKTNFGFLAVRVAKSISEHFGGGTLTSSEGDVHEKNIFGKRARWVDYSGPIAAGTGLKRRVEMEGITYFDHPKNPRYPTHWHVRGDGWMGASFGMHEGLTITPEKPLTLRYLLYVHRGTYNQERASLIGAAFAKRPGLQVKKSSKPHRQYEVRRIKKDAP